MTGTNARFEDVVALQPQHAELLAALRALALRLHPGHVEVSRPGDRAVSWGWGPKKMSEAYICAMPFRNHVNLAFYRGADLPDPHDRLEGLGKAMRHIRFTSVDQLDDPPVHQLIIEAREERRRALGLAKLMETRPSRHARPSGTHACLTQGQSD